MLLERARRGANPICLDSDIALTLLIQVNETSENLVAISSLLFRAVALTSAPIRPGSGWPAGLRWADGAQNARRRSDGSRRSRGIDRFKKTGVRLLGLPLRIWAAIAALDDFTIPCGVLRSAASPGSVGSAGVQMVWSGLLETPFAAGHLSKELWDLQDLSADAAVGLLERRCGHDR